MHRLYHDPIADPPATRTIGPFLERTRIAYFTMEIALRPEMHTYSGGLGVLAGDTARSSADLGLPMVFVTLLSRQGYLRQEIDADGGQLEHPDPWEPVDWATPLRAKVALVLEGREVWVRPWLHVIRSPIGERVPVLLLDTRLEENAPEDRALTDRLYGPGADYRLKQEAVLGIGGLRVLQALGFDVRIHHMNEGHAALLALDFSTAGVELWMEPGRYVVAEAGVLLAKVTQTKTKGAAGYVGVATGMNSLIRPALYGAHHDIVNLSRLGETADGIFDVVGPICETGDVLGHDRALPTTTVEGDILLIATTGAYGASMASHYNLRSPAEELLLR